MNDPMTASLTGSINPELSLQTYALWITKTSVFCLVHCLYSVGNKITTTWAVVSAGRVP